MKNTIKCLLRHPVGLPQRAQSLACLLVATTFICVFAVSTTNAATYYVDPIHGADNQDGSTNTPWNTMPRAMPSYNGSGPKVQRGDTVYLRTGNYGTVTIAYDPSAADPNYPTSWAQQITYKAQAGHKPVFNYLEISGDYERYLVFDGISIEDDTEKGRDYLVYLRTSDHIKFLNLKLVGHWSNTMWYGLTSNGIHVSIATQGSDIEDVTIQGCDISRTLRGIMFTCISPQAIGSNIVIKNNSLHNLAGTAINLAIFEAKNTILVEGNHVYDEYPVVQTQEITGTIIGTLAKDAVVTQPSTGATGTIYSVSGSNIIIYPTSQVLFEGGAGKTITNSNNGQMTNPSVVNTGYSHASCVTIRCNNVNVRNNIFNGFGTTSGIMTYPPYNGSAAESDGYTNITIENNLFYDMGAVYAVRLENLGSYIRFNNNTIIGYHIASAKGVSKYGTQVRILPLDGLAAGKRHDIYFYNNLIAGGVELSYNDMHLTGFSENYNIFWACGSLDGKVWLPAGFGTLQGNRTFILTGDTTEPSTFESGFFVNPDYSRGNDFTKYTDGGPNGKNLDYKLLSTALAIDFCALNKGTTTDIEGHTRADIPSVGNDGSNFADAGCYEYMGGVSNPTPHPPNADAGSDCTVTDSDQSGSEQVTLDGSGSSDPDGSIVSYVWYKGGVQIATGVKPTVSLPVGRHTITLKVTDNSDLNDTDTVIITVEAE